MINVQRLCDEKIKVSKATRIRVGPVSSGMKFEETEVRRDCGGDGI
jgi:hypothetical protein